MHELSIALSILEMAEEEGARHSAKVTAIHLRLGALSGVALEALRSAYELAREPTSLAAAELVIEEVPLVTYCPVCASEQMPLSPSELRCPTCGTPTPTVVRGRELEVAALEIEG
jgi:hydrogenase nickel incorporation protein HypA/HybF